MSEDQKKQLGTQLWGIANLLRVAKEANNNIVFIAAGRDDRYAKEGNQDAQRDEDVALIVEACRKRETRDRHCDVGSLDVLADNDCNLNISRYVDTFEEEESVDLAAVSAMRKQLDADLKANEAEIAAFCQELNIDRPF